MKEIWIKYKLAIMIVGFMLALIAVAYFLAFPLVLKIKNTSFEIQKKIVDQEVERSRFDQLPKMEENWNDIQARKDKIEVILDKESEVGFIENVDSIAMRSGNVVDLKIGEGTNVREVAKIKAKDKNENSEKGILDEVGYLNFFPIQINIKGDYVGLYNFIQLLENSHFYVNIISIDSKKQIDDSADVSENVFSPKDDKKEKIKKEIIVTNINAIVYTKK
jgi:hypothetical protein